MPAVQTPTPDLLVDHAHADHAMRALFEAYRLRDLQAAVLQLDLFESDLLAHLQREEEMLLPRYHEVQPEDAAAIVVAHRGLRLRLSRLRRELAAGRLELTSLRKLAIDLTLHHAHVETGLYRWARGLARTGTN